MADRIARDVEKIWGQRTLEEGGGRACFCIATGVGLATKQLRGAVERAHREASVMRIPGAMFKLVTRAEPEGLARTCTSRLYED